MKADWTRKTHVAKKHYCKVNMQQGRVQIDADWNEQVDIEDYLHRTYLTDLVGNSGAPKGNDGFEIIANDSKIGYKITRGNYYVDGILCQNEQKIEVTDQPDLQPLYFNWDSMVKSKEGIRRFIDFLKRTFYEFDLKLGDLEPIDIEIKDNTTQILKVGKSVVISLDTKANKATLKINGQAVYEFIARSDPLEIGYTPAMPTVPGIYVVYLDVWERHITFLDDPAIREKALGGPDTATRTKIVWQVKLVHLKSTEKVDLENCDCGVNFKPPKALGSLYARVKPVIPVEGSCETVLEHGYAGIENQLYRVEIHTGGQANDKATFKWSRDNGVVVVGLIGIDSTNNKIVVSDTGKNSKLGFAPLQWIEITDDHHELWGIRGTLVRLKEVKDNVLFFDFNTIIGDAPTNENFPVGSNPKVRRWDSAGEIEVQVLAENEGYIGLEDGIEVKFGKKGTYNTGNYWLIPARIAARAEIGDVEWPKDENGPLSLPPEGITHHLCPLALLKYRVKGSPELELRDCRKLFTPMTVFSVNTGTVGIKYNLDDNSDKGAFGPFYHYLQSLCCPPAIILGLVSEKVSDKPPKHETQVKYMEDYRLKGINFKAVDIGLHTFGIALDTDATTPQTRQGSIVLRWWAIPGQEQIYQSNQIKS